jgi:hypothetical protein
MKPEATAIKDSPPAPTLTPIIRKSLVTYLISVVAVPAICFIFGLRSLEHMGAGFMYASLGLALSGALILAGNTVPAQLSKLSLPKYSPPSSRHPQEAASDGAPLEKGAKRFFFTTLVCAAFLLVTGLLLKML